MGCEKYHRDQYQEPRREHGVSVIRYNESPTIIVKNHAAMFIIVVMRGMTCVIARYSLGNGSNGRSGTTVLHACTPYQCNNVKLEALAFSHQSRRESRWPTKVQISKSFETLLPTSLLPWINTRALSIHYNDPAHWPPLHKARHGSRMQAHQLLTPLRTSRSSQWLTLACVLHYQWVYSIISQPTPIKA